jgi:glucose/arabinose dehydrogenase
MLRVATPVGLKLVALGILSFACVACADQAQLPVSAGIGPDPQLPEPEPELIPTVNTAEAIGWQEGQSPSAADGMQVQAFAEDLDHPRWLYVLPNGDVLVAESNAPERPEHDDGIRAWVTYRGRHLHEHLLRAVEAKRANSPKGYFPQIERTGANGCKPRVDWSLPTR